MYKTLVIRGEWSWVRTVEELRVRSEAIAVNVGKASRYLRPILPLLFVMALRPAFGQGVVSDGGELETVTTAAESILATMNSVLRVLSIVAIMACGLGAGFGRMEWGTVGKVFIGLVIANAATTVVEYFGGGVSQT